jgi:hypothetical protein
MKSRVRPIAGSRLPERIHDRSDDEKDHYSLAEAIAETTIKKYRIMYGRTRIRA